MFTKDSGAFNWRHRWDLNPFTGPKHYSAVGKQSRHYKELGHGISRLRTPVHEYFCTKMHHTDSLSSVIADSRKVATGLERRVLLVFDTQLISPFDVERPVRGQAEATRLHRKLERFARTKEGLCCRHTEVQFDAAAHLDFESKAIARTHIQNR